MTSIAQAYVEILPSARGMGRALQGEMGGVESTLSGGTRRGFLGGLLNLAGPLAAVIGGLGIGRMVSDSITAASDLSETRSAVMTVFGDAGAAVQSFASTAATELGQTEQQALEAARTFGIFGQAAGLSGGDLSSFSTDLVGLAGDFASFNNVDPETAIAAIGAGLRGESEPLRQFGIMLDDAALRARALELGIYDGNGALTQQQRVMAAQAEIFAQAGVQQGDFARTSDGLANQQRILSAGWADLSATIGMVFLPVVTQIVSFLNTAVMPALTQFLGFLTAGGGGEFFTAITGALGPLIPAFMQLWTSLSPVSLLFQALLPHLPVIAGLMQQIGTVIVSLLATALTAIAPLISMVVETLALLIGAVLPLVPAILQLISPLLELVGAILPPLIALFMAVIKPVLDLAGAIIKALMPVIQGLLEVIAGLIEFVVGVFTGDWNRAWQGVQRVFTGFVDAIRGLIDGGLRLLFEGIPNFIRDIFGGAGTWLVNAGRSIIQGFIDGIRGMIGAVGDAVGGIMDFVAGFFPNSPAKHGPLSGSGWRDILNSGGAIGDAFSSGFGGIDDVLTSGVRVASSAAITSALTVTGAGVDRPIYTETGTLLGWIREQAQGAAQLVWNDMDERSALEVRAGVR